ncbi:carbon storage regulator CsrA [Paradesulfitobacterium ferrireducens]|uniref:carbon storage regulator CsrA n=1 Tax=Paradesulfitobacterium ferrireducens TaxID=2816476 RepID=UPI001A8F680C|nr:carbon storage regulator CsrA [Paradesulfitobacterium ferrireducens]
MLVLSRKLNEKIKIGEDIEIVVVAVSGDTVRLGIKAPPSVKILRNEVYEEIQNQNREAMISVADVLQYLDLGTLPTSIKTEKEK